MSTQLPKITRNNAPGEQAIPPQTVAQVAPDVAGPQGQQKLQQSLQVIQQAKPKLDQFFQRIGKQVGVDVSTRIKSQDAITRKVAQKRLSGRDYHPVDINDAYGARFIANTPQQKQAVISKIEDAQKQGLVHIISQKEMDEDQGTYKAYHTDLAIPIAQGQTVRIEVQIMDQHMDAKAVASHDVHAQFGEKPPPEAQDQVKMQNKIIDTLPKIKAKGLASKLVQVHKANNDKPINPAITAGMVINAKKQSS